MPINKMVTLLAIKTAAQTYQSDVLRALIDRAESEGIEGCDSEDVYLTIKLNMRHVAMYAEKSPAHQQNLIASIAALEKGLHPYDDQDAKSTLFANAAIAKAKL